jgi:hypothetical protein
MGSWPARIYVSGYKPAIPECPNPPVLVVAADDELAAFLLGRVERWDT